MNKEDCDYLICDDPALQQALDMDLQDYDGEIFYIEKNVCWTEDATYVALYEQDIKSYGLIINE